VRLGRTFKGGGKDSWRHAEGFPRRKGREGAKGELGPWGLVVPIRAAEVTGLEGYWRGKERRTGGGREETPQAERGKVALPIGEVLRGNRKCA